MEIGLSVRYSKKYCTYLNFDFHRCWTPFSIDKGFKWFGICWQWLLKVQFTFKKVIWRFWNFEYALPTSLRWWFYICRIIGKFDKELQITDVDREVDIFVTHLWCFLGLENLSSSSCHRRGRICSTTALTATCKRISLKMQLGVCCKKYYTVEDLFCMLYWGELNVASICNDVISIAIESRVIGLL